MSQHQLFQKGSKADKTKIKREKFFLGTEHGVGTYVCVRGLTTKEAEDNAKYVQTLGDGGKSDGERKNAGYQLLACCLVDDDGKSLFDDADDVEANFDVSASDFVKIMEVMNRLSGFDKDRSKN